MSPLSLIQKQLQREQLRDAAKRHNAMQPVAADYTSAHQAPRIGSPTRSCTYRGVTYTR